MSNRHSYMGDAIALDYTVWRGHCNRTLRLEGTTVRDKFHSPALAIRVDINGRETKMVLSEENVVELSKQLIDWLSLHPREAEQ